MTREATRTAAEMLEDDDIRGQVAAGDLSALSDLELSEEEAAMLSAAADDFPEVAGFDFDDKHTFTALQFPKVRISPSIGRLQTYINKF